MSMDPEIYRRVAKLEKAVEALLQFSPEAAALIRPRDAMAICDEKKILGPGLACGGIVGEVDPEPVLPLKRAADGELCINIDARGMDPGTIDTVLRAIHKLPKRSF